MVRQVFWSSKIESRWFWWRWSATIYRGNGDHEIRNAGVALSQRRAEQKRNRWLISEGETP